MSAPLKSDRSWAANPEASYSIPSTNHGEPGRVLMRHGEWLVPESERPQIAPAPTGYALKAELERLRADEHGLAWAVGVYRPVRPSTRMTALIQAA